MPKSELCKALVVQAWHVCETTCFAAWAELVNAHSRQPCRALGRRNHVVLGWTTLQSWNQGWKAPGHINPKYGAGPGKIFYTHISDQYAPFGSEVVNVRPAIP